jgi:hypothetical protein
VSPGVLGGEGWTKAAIHVTLHGQTLFLGRPTSPVLANIVADLILATISCWRIFGTVTGWIESAIAKIELVEQVIAIRIFNPIEGDGYFIIHPHWTGAGGLLSQWNDWMTVLYQAEFFPFITNRNTIAIMSRETTFG